MQHKPNTRQTMISHAPQSTMDSDSFVWDLVQNPYNFVSLDRQRATDTITSDGLRDRYGVIDVELTTLTPLFIPNMTCDFALGHCTAPGDDPLHKSLEFFSYRKIEEGDAAQAGYNPAMPIIPGSSLRGSLRSAYEALTNSCMSTLTDQPLTGRLPFPRKPGLLRKTENGWTLEKAVRYPIQTYQKRSTPPIVTLIESKDDVYITCLGNGQEYHTGDLVRFDADAVGKPAKNIGYGKRGGYLLIGDVFGNKHFDHLFVGQGENIPIRDAHIDRLQNVLETFRDPTINKWKEHRMYAGYNLSIAQNGGVLPVWYLEFDDSKTKQKAYHLSPGCISRSSYNQQLTDIARLQGNHAPCDNVDQCCPACALFGMVVAGKQEGEKSAVCGRVRFTDAKPVEDGHGETATDNRKYFVDHTVTLSELANPHPTNMPLYTERMNEKDEFWTYDFAVESYQGNSPQGRVIAPGELKLRGRKFYWHHRFDEPKHEKKTNRNATVRLVDAGQRFRFKVYYDGLSATELTRLCTLLELGSQNNPYAHKLGHGKPLGLGSVRYTITGVRERSIKLGAGVESGITYALEQVTDPVRGASIGKAFGTYLTEKTKMEIMALLKFDGGAWENTPKYLAPEGYRWYMDNLGETIMKPRYVDELPTATNQDQQGRPRKVIQEEPKIPDDASLEVGVQALMDKFNPQRKPKDNGKRRK